MKKTTATHRDLIAWQEAMNLVTLVYRDTAAFPKGELFGLTNQIRRAAVSVPSNIAEGAGRSSRKELGQFVAIACGSLAELETQLEIAVALGYLRANSAALTQTRRVGRLATALRRSLV